MAEQVPQEPSDQGEQSSMEERQVDIQREILLQEINILKERLRNVETRVKEICENLRNNGNIPHHLRRHDRVQPLPEL